MPGIPEGLVIWLAKFLLTLAVLFPNNMLSPQVQMVESAAKANPTRSVPRATIIFDKGCPAALIT